MNKKPLLFVFLNNLIGGAVIVLIVFFMTQCTIEETRQRGEIERLKIEKANP